MGNSVQSDLGERLRIARVKRRKKQKEVAAAAGITQTRLSNIETGRVTPRWGEVEQITHALGINIVFQEQQDAA